MEARRKPSFFLFLFLASLPLMSGILYTSALPSISTYFHVSKAFTEATLYLFVLGISVGSLVYPLVSDRFGRRKALFTGLIICLLGTLVCLSSSWFSRLFLLQIGRFIQAVGASGAIVICVTQINECYTTKERPRILSLFMLFPVIPNISVILGGYLTEHFGWEGCFYFLLFYTGILLLLSFFFVFETLEKKEENAFKLIAIKSLYSSEFKNPIVVLAGLYIGLVISTSYIFSGVSPFIGINMLKTDPERFSFYFSLPSVFFVVGSLLGAFLSKRISKLAMILTGTIVILASSIVMLFLFAFGFINLYSIFILYSTVLVGVVFVASMSVVIGMQYSYKTSSGVAVFNFLSLFYTVVPVVILSLIPDHFILQLPLLFTAQGLIVLFALPLMRKRIKERENIK